MEEKWEETKEDRALEFRGETDYPQGALDQHVARTLWQ